MVRVTTLPWGMVFPHAGPLPRHPSQLYEFLVRRRSAMSLLLWYAQKPRPLGAVSGMFLLRYGLYTLFSRVCARPDIGHGY